MIRVHHLNCVNIYSPENGKAVGHCLLIETGQRLILVDAGISIKDTESPDSRIGRNLINIVGFNFDKAWTAVSQIRALGLDPEKVTDCIISHLDPDHIGGLADFPGAKVHIGLEEFSNFNTGNYRYLQHQLDHRPTVITYAKTYETWFGLEARRIASVYETEIFLIPLFGHTAGHCGVAVNCRTSWLFYIGDAYYLRKELTDPKHPVHILAEARADNNQLRIESLNTIRQFLLKNPTINVFGYHDVGELETYCLD